ncbi:unnamed protein product [Closterium sp. Naga37s-1]|nr:unnamed protein product [Closterium sp. Naga37s-1]
MATADAGSGSGLRPGLGGTGLELAVGSEGQGWRRSVAVMEAVRQLEAMMREPAAVLDSMKDKLSLEDLEILIAYFAQQGRDMWQALEVYDWMVRGNRVERRTRRLIHVIMDQRLGQLLQEGCPTEKVLRLVGRMVDLGLPPDFPLKRMVGEELWDRGAVAEVVKLLRMFRNEEESARKEQGVVAGVRVMAWNEEEDEEEEDEEWEESEEGSVWTGLSESEDEVEIGSGGQKDGEARPSDCATQGNTFSFLPRPPARLPLSHHLSRFHLLHISQTQPLPPLPRPRPHPAPTRTPSSSSSPPLPSLLSLSISLSLVPAVIRFPGVGMGAAESRRQDVRLSGVERSGVRSEQQQSSRAAGTEDSSRGASTGGANEAKRGQGQEGKQAGRESKSREAEAEREGDEAAVMRAAEAAAEAAVAAVGEEEAAMRAAEEREDLVGLLLLRAVSAGQYRQVLPLPRMLREAGVEVGVAGFGAVLTGAVKEQEKLSVARRELRDLQQMGVVGQLSPLEGLLLEVSIDRQAVRAGGESRPLSPVLSVPFFQCPPPLDAPLSIFPSLSLAHVGPWSNAAAQGRFSGTSQSRLSTTSSQCPLLNPPLLNPPLLNPPLLNPPLLNPPLLNPPLLNPPLLNPPLVPLLAPMQGQRCSTRQVFSHRLKRYSQQPPLSAHLPILPLSLPFARMQVHGATLRHEAEQVVQWCAEECEGDLQRLREAVCERERQREERLAVLGQAGKGGNEVNGREAQPYQQVAEEVDGRVFLWRDAQIAGLSPGLLSGGGMREEEEGYRIGSQERDESSLLLDLQRNRKGENLYREELERLRRVQQSEKERERERKRSREIQRLERERERDLWVLQAGEVAAARAQAGMQGKLVTLWFNAGHPEQAERALWGVVQQGAPVPGDLAASVAGLYAYWGDHTGLNSFIQRLEALGSPLDEWAYALMVGGALKGGHVDVAAFAVREMVRRGMQPNAQQLAIVLRRLQRGDAGVEAYLGLCAALADVGLLEPTLVFLYVDLLRLCILRML